MSPAYIEAVTTHLPEAALVFDRFHVIKLYNDKLSELRRSLFHQLRDTLEKNVLKGVRWLLLKRPEDLDRSRREPERLQKALRLNEPLAMAYHLKDELNEIWEQDDRESAEALLMDWIVYAESSGVRMLQQFSRTLRFHAQGNRHGNRQAGNVLHPVEAGYSVGKTVRTVGIFIRDIRDFSRFRIDFARQEISAVDFAGLRPLDNLEG